MKRLVIGAMLLATAVYANPREGATTLAVDRTRYIEVVGEIDQTILPKAAQLLALTETSKAPVFVLITSPGGSVLAGKVFESAIEMAQSRGVPVICVVPVMAASMGFSILAHCSERYVLPNALLLFHPASTMQQRVTAASAKALAKELGDLDDEHKAFLIDSMGIDPDTLNEAYYQEKLWSATQLSRVINAGWMTQVHNITGISNPLTLDPGTSQSAPVTNSTPKASPASPKYKVGQCLKSVSETVLMRILGLAKTPKGEAIYVAALLPPAPAVVLPLSVQKVDAAPTAEIQPVECPK